MTNSLPHHYRIREDKEDGSSGGQRTKRSSLHSRPHEANPAEFHRRLRLMKRWFEEFNDNQRTEVTKAIEVRFAYVAERGVESGREGGRVARRVSQLVPDAICNAQDCDQHRTRENAPKI